MSKRTKLDMGLIGYDELFMNDKEREENRLPKIYNLPLSEIDDFPDHPFTVRMDEDMEQLTESVKQRGVITPITVREKEDGRYELVSGHRRKKACELAGLDTVPAEVKDLTRDEAILLMVDSNLQRSTILPSEKAFAYKMKLEAMNRQGLRSDLTSGPVGQKSKVVNSRDELADASIDSARQIQRYVRLTELEPELLNLVDEGKIALRPAVEISYLSKDSQKELAEAISMADATPSHTQAIKMRRFAEEDRLTSAVIESIMTEEKPNQKAKINLKYDDCRRYIPSSIPYEKTSEFIMKALEYYHRYLQRQRENER